MLPEPALPRVLIVDGDAAYRRLLLRFFRSQGYAVAEAENGERALSGLRTCTDPVVVVFDYQMPAMNGFAFLQAVERDPQLRARHGFVLVTGAHTTLPADCIRLLLRLGIVRLTKPFTLEHVLDLVTAATEHVEATEEMPSVTKPPPIFWSFHSPA